MEGDKIIVQLYKVVCISKCRVVGYGYASNMPLVDLQPTNALLGVWVFHRPPESSTNCVAALGRTLRLGARALVLAHQDLIACGESACREGRKLRATASIRRRLI